MRQLFLGTTLLVVAFGRPIISYSCLIILILISYCEILNSGALFSLQSLQELALVGTRIDGNPTQACPRGRLVDPVHCFAERRHELEWTQFVLIRNDCFGQRHLKLLAGLTRCCIHNYGFLFALHRLLGLLARSILAIHFRLLFHRVSLGCIFALIYVYLLHVAFVWALLLLQAIDLVVLQERQRFDQI